MDINTLSASDLQALQAALTPRTNKYIPIKPTAKQTAALLMNNVFEMLYGGAAGGGKSVFILAAALQYVDIPGYSAILFRKTFADLMLPSALIPLSHEWLAPFISDGSVVWKDKDKKYIFKESGATLTFGYLDAAQDHLRYQGAAFQFVGFDEVTHIAPEQFRYLFSRLRRPKGSKVPLRIRSTANPGGVYGDYYYTRYFKEITTVNDGLDIPKRVFLPSGLKDNPYLDAEEYLRALDELDDVTRQQLAEGDWEIRDKGDMFDVTSFRVISAEQLPVGRRSVRWWDMASTDPKLLKRKNRSKTDPDYTVGLLMSRFMNSYYIEDICRVRQRPEETHETVVSTARSDGSRVSIRMEKEGGSAGETVIQWFAQDLGGFDFVGIKSIVSKKERAAPFAAALARGNVYILDRCRYTTELFAELEAFPWGAHDDIVDSCSGAYNELATTVQVYAPQASVSLCSKTDSFLDDMGPAPVKGSYWRTNMTNWR